MASTRAHGRRERKLPVQQLAILGKKVALCPAREHVT